MEVNAEMTTWSTMAMYYILHCESQMIQLFLWRDIRKQYTITWGDKHLDIVNQIIKVIVHL